MRNSSSRAAVAKPMPRAGGPGDEPQPVQGLIQDASTGHKNILLCEAKAAKIKGYPRGHKPVRQKVGVREPARGGGIRGTSVGRNPGGR